MRDLRTVRNDAKLSRREAAEILGISVRTLEGWESGKASHAAYMACVCRLLAILTGQERVIVTTCIRTPPRKP